MKHLPNINFLRYFYSAGKNKSMSKAAAENFVTQSAISQGIDKLEIELGKKLLTNRKNRFELTSEGELLLDQCERILSIFSDIEDSFNEKESVYRGKLSFATSHSFAISLLPIYYQRLFRLHPSVEPILRLSHSGIVREWVSKGDVNFGIILAKEKDRLTFKTQTILQGKYGIYKTKQSVKSSDDRLIISEESNEDQLIINYLKEKKGKIPSILSVLSWEVIANMVQQGLGMGIIPDYVAKRHHLVPVRFAIPSIPYQIIAIWSQNKELSRNAKMFIELMQK